MMKIIASLILIGGYVVYLSITAISSASTLTKIAHEKQCAIEEISFVTGDIKEVSKACLIEEKKE